MFSKMKGSFPVLHMFYWRTELVCCTYVFEKIDDISYKNLRYTTNYISSDFHFKYVKD